VYHLEDMGSSLLRSSAGIPSLCCFPFTGIVSRDMHVRNASVSHTAVIGTLKTCLTSHEDSMEGYQGPQGIDGMHGMNGLQDSQGLQGNEGLQGQQGNDGMEVSKASKVHPQRPYIEISSI